MQNGAQLSTRKMLMDHVELPQSLAVRVLDDRLS